MASLTDAQEGLRSTDGKENFQRLTRLLMCGGVRLLREKFDHFHSPAHLPLTLVDPAIITQLKKAKLSRPEWDCLYPSRGTFGKSTDFDITLTFRLLRTICNLTEPPTGWNNLPNSKDHSLEAELARIKYYRNSVYGHNQKMEIANSEFYKLWKEISEALLRIAASISNAKEDEWKEAINELLRDPLTVEAQRYVDEFQLWYKNDMDVKEAVEQIKDQLQQVNAELRDQLQQVNVDVRDQLHHVGDQLQQINQRLDCVTTVIQIVVEKISEGGQLIASSYLPVLPTSQVAVGSERMVAVPINQEQQQSGSAEAGFGEHLVGNRQSAPTESFIWKVVLEYFNEFLEYLKVRLGVGIVSYRVGSLLVTVACSSSQIFERLWEDYCSGHLNEVAQQKLVTPDVLEKLGLKELKLKTTIAEQEYKKCKEFFFGIGQISPSSVASRESTDVDAINDVMEMLQLMNSLKVSLRGTRTLDEMKQRVKMKLKSSEKKSSWMAKEPFSVLTEAKKEDERKRATLHKFYEDTEVCLSSMDNKVRALLEKNLGNLKEKIALHKQNLEQKEYTVLVAGETSSGKSTLLNLILGERILPYSVLSTTSTICELKYGTKPKLVAHFKDKDPKTGLTEKTLWLSQSMEASQQTYLQDIASFVHVKTNREKGSDYKKIELFWPHSLLKQGIVIVDSPGVGESTIMDDMVKEYLPEAFAFIYVINTVNAGGIQRDRVEKLFELSRKVSFDQHTEFSPTRALFVCNKWDQIRPSEADEVKNHIVKKLTQCWPSIDPDSQIICMSSTNAMHAQGYGIVTEEFTCLMNGVKSMVLKSIEARLQIQWRWLDYLLSRMAYVTKAFIRNSYNERAKVIERMMFITERLVMIEKQQSSVKKELQEYLEYKTDHAVTALSKYLKSSDVKKKFTSWTLDDIPNAEESWVMTKHYIQKALMKRLQDVIATWEEENHVFSDARTSLLQYFEQKFNFVEGKLQNLESSVIGDDAASPASVPLAPDNLIVAERVIIGVTSPIWVPVGLAAMVVGVPVVMIMAFIEKLEHWSEEREYKKDKFGFVATVSEKFLSEEAEEKNLRSYVGKQLEQSQICLRQIVARIPELIEADKMLCRQLIDEDRLQKKMEDFYKPLYQRSLRLRDNMAMFGIKEVGTMDIACEELEWNDDSSSLLGSGAFASVYRGKLKTRIQARPVALKVWKDELNSSNASGFLAETVALRKWKLNYPFILKFYGATLLKEGNNVRGILVMELCKESLRRRIFLHPENIPAVSTDPATMTKIIRWAGNIASALEFMHEREIVHRDLKLEKILLSHEDIVKVADVGVAGVGVAYIAPEVIRSNEYDGKTDVYSFGIMMWEMWYGKRAFFEEGEDLSALLGAVAGGKRPSHVEDNIKPPNGWQHLMERCWDGRAERRPTAAMCQSELTVLYRDAVTPLNTGY